MIKIGRAQAFIDDLRRVQRADKPRFEVFLGPGATPSDLRGVHPIAWRAISGHSGTVRPTQQAMGYREIGNDEAPILWHGTALLTSRELRSTGSFREVVFRVAGLTLSSHHATRSWQTTQAITFRNRFSMRRATFRLMLSRRGHREKCST